MAFTATILKRDVHGSEAVVHYLVTADGATGSIATGLGTVTAAHIAPKSMASAPFAVRCDEGVASTAIAGTVGVTGVTSGDAFYLTVYGR